MDRVEQHRRLAWAIASDFYMPGSDRDDVRQEAMIALLIADRDFVPGHCEFKTFAHKVIRRRLTDAVKRATRKKHCVLSESFRFEALDRGPEYSSSGGSWALDPAAILESKEDALEMLRRVKDDLTPLQRTCLISAANGFSHEEIARDVGGSPTISKKGKKRYPRVYNALYEAHAKLAA